MGGKGESQRNLWWHVEVSKTSDNIGVDEEDEKLNFNEPSGPGLKQISEPSRRE